MHLARSARVSQAPTIPSAKQLTNYRLNVFILRCDIKKIAGAESKQHRLVVFTEVVVDLRRHQRSKLPVLKTFIFVQDLTSRTFLLAGAQSI